MCGVFDQRVFNFNGFYSSISRHLKQALIASEDANFVNNYGVEVDALLSALEKNVKKGRIVMGGSTISQQLARNLFLSPQKSYIRKIQEFIITGMLETLMTKEQIFEIYMNVVEWGRGVYGAQAASYHYFHILAANLNDWQAARLAVMLPKPKFYDAHRDSAYLRQRTQVILGRMSAVSIPKDTSKKLKKKKYLDRKLKNQL